MNGLEGTFKEAVTPGRFIMEWFGLERTFKGGFWKGFAVPALFSSPVFPFKYIDCSGPFPTPRKVLGVSLWGHLQQLVGC